MAETIRQLRDRQGWTQLELAMRVRATPSTVFRWESGRAQPTVAMLRQLAQAFGVSMDDIELVPPAGKAEPLRAAS